MIESAYATIDQEGLRKKVQAVNTTAAPTTSAVAKPTATEMPTPAITSSYLTVGKKEEASANPAAIAGDASGLEKVGGITKDIIAPVASAGLSIYGRQNTVAESGKEADALGVKTTMDLASAGGQIGSMFGPVGGLVGTGAGAAIGAIYSVGRSAHDKKVRQRREQKKYIAGLVKASTERDRDNMMEDAQASIGAEQNLIKQQIGLIG